MSREGTRKVRLSTTVAVVVLLLASTAWGQGAPDRSPMNAIPYLKSVIDNPRQDPNPVRTDSLRAASHTPLVDIGLGSATVKDFYTFRFDQDYYGVAVLFHNHHSNHDTVWCWVIDGNSGSANYGEDVHQFFVGQENGENSINDLSVTEGPVSGTGDRSAYVTWVRSVDAERDLLVIHRVSRDGIVWSRGVGLDQLDPQPDHFYSPSIAVDPYEDRGIVTVSVTDCSAGAECPITSWHTIGFWQVTGSLTGVMDRVWNSDYYQWPLTSATFNNALDAYVVAVKRETSATYDLINFKRDLSGHAVDRETFDHGMLGDWDEPNFIKSEYNDKTANDIDTMSIMTDFSFYWIGPDMDLVPGPVPNPHKALWYGALGEDRTSTQDVARTVKPTLEYTGGGWTWSALEWSWHKSPQSPRRQAIIHDYLPWDCTSSKTQVDPELFVAGIRYSPRMTWPPTRVTLTILEMWGDDDYGKGL